MIENFYKERQRQPLFSQVDKIYRKDWFAYDLGRPWNFPGHELYEFQVLWKRNNVRQTAEHGHHWQDKLSEEPPAEPQNHSGVPQHRHWYLFSISWRTLYSLSSQQFILLGFIFFLKMLSAKVSKFCVNAEFSISRHYTFEISFYLSTNVYQIFHECWYWCTNSGMTTLKSSWLKKRFYKRWMEESHKNGSLVRSIRNLADQKFIQGME